MEAVNGCQQLFSEKKRGLMNLYEDEHVSGDKSAFPSLSTSPCQPHFKKLRIGVPEDDDNLGEFLYGVLRMVVGAEVSCGEVLKIRSENLPTCPEDIPEFLTDFLEQQFKKDCEPVRIKRLIRLMNFIVSASKGHQDRMVLKAVEMLPSLVFSFILDIVKEDEPSPVTKKDEVESFKGNTLKSTDVLLLCLSLESESSGFMPMTADMWFEYFCSMEMTTQTGVLKKLLLAVGERAKWVLGEDIANDKHFLGLKVVLTSPKCAKAFAALLLDEVEQSRDKPGKFFQTTELGSLLSLSPLPKMNEKTLRLEGDHNVARLFDAYKGNPRWPAPNPTQEDCPMALLQSGMKEVQNVLKSAFGHLFQSEDELLEDAAVTWAATVLNKNGIRSVIADPADAARQAACGEGYMQNFCSLILGWYESRREPSQTLDLCCSSSPSCRLELQRDERLTGRHPKPKQDSNGRRNKHSHLPTEYFHLCQQALSLSCVPAMRFTREIQQILMFSFPRHLTAAAQMLYKQQNFLLRVYAKAVWNSSHCKMVASFYEKQIGLLMNLLDETSGDKSESAMLKQREVFSRIPEIHIKDLLDWFTYTSEIGMKIKPLLVELFIDFCIALLKRPDLMKNTLLHAKLLDAIYALCRNAKCTHLVLPKLRPAVRILCSAFLRAYVDVSALDGHHIDRGFFNSYVARKDISELFRHLWDRKECQRIILSENSTEMFENFLDAVLHTCHLCIRISQALCARSSRLTGQFERGEWRGLSAKEQCRKVRLVHRLDHNKEKAWSVAENSLLILRSLAGHHSVAVHFTRPPLSYRTASFVQFITSSLFGGCISQGNGCLHAFPIFVHIAEFVVEVADLDPGNRSGFICSLVSTPVLELDNLLTFQKSLTGVVCNEKGLKRTMERLNKVIGELKHLHSEKREQVENDRKDWMSRASLTWEVEKDLVRIYQDRLGKFKLTTASLLQSHSFRPIVQEASPTSDKMTTLEKELEELQASLAVHPDGSTFVVRDGERPDVLRCLLSGPAGTPYSGGVFVLDVYCPVDYPRVPPLIKLLNAGHDASFDSFNLRANNDLSRLLRGDANKEDDNGLPTCSEYSLKEVLISLKSLIFEKDLYCRDSENGSLSGSGDGMNPRNEIWAQLLTVYNGMLLQLRSPPCGLEEVVSLHFSLLQNAILGQCHEWLTLHSEAKNLESFSWTVLDLRREFQTLNGFVSSDRLAEGN